MRRFRLRVAWGVLGLWWLLAGGLHAEPHFRLPAQPLTVPMGGDVLNEADRAFLAGLPEVRVALQRVGAPPYEVVGADDEVSGLQADMLVYLARSLGLRLRPVIYGDWSSVLRAVREHQADMVLTLGVTSDRLQYLAFTLGTVQVPVAAFGRLGQAPMPLAHAKIALEAEYWTHEIVRRQYPEATILTVDSTKAALQAVARGRADYYVEREGAGHRSA